MSVGVVANIQIKEGKAQEFEMIIGELVEAVNSNEPGCELYQFYRSQANDLEYVVFERYADEASQRNHSKTEHFKRIGARMAACLAAAPKTISLDAI